MKDIVRAAATLALLAAVVCGGVLFLAASQGNWPAGISGAALIVAAGFTVRRFGNG